MIPQTTTAKASNWKKVLRFTFRFALALFILLFKLVVAIATFIIRFFVALFSGRSNAEDQAPKGIPAASFERDSPVNKYEPYD